jgi:hypothetical protein
VAPSERSNSNYNKYEVMKNVKDIIMNRMIDILVHQLKDEVISPVSYQARDTMRKKISYLVHDQVSKKVYLETKDQLWNQIRITIIRRKL